jgi:hypothetical protein
MYWYECQVCRIEKFMKGFLQKKWNNLFSSDLFLAISLLSASFLLRA